MPIFHRSLCLVSCVFFLGCDSIPTPSNVADFSKPQIIDTSTTALQLSRALHISHRIVRKKVSSGKYDFDSYLYDAEFSNLSEQDFYALKAIYSGWSASENLVAFRPHATWHLGDFLPPIMQASLNNLFLPEAHTLQIPKIFGPNANGQRIDTSVSLLSNCWGTAYEIVRAARSQQDTLAIFYAPQRLAREAFLNPKWSEEIHPVSKDTFSNPNSRNANLRPGDVLLVGDKWLQHVAMFIDNDIYFEKAGSGDSALYRISHWDTLSKTWPPELHGYSWRRFNKQKLPDPSELFNLKTSLPEGTSLDIFSENEIKNLTAEINRDDRTGQPLSASWMGRRNVLLTRDQNGRSTLAAQAE
jgi:hypothetical protein